MAAKMLACLELSFQKRRTTTIVKGRNFYDLLWFIQQRIEPFEEKLAKDGLVSYTTKSAFLALKEKASLIRPQDLAVDLLPLFEQRIFIEQWIDSYHENFNEWVKNYLT